MYTSTQRSIHKIAVYLQLSLRVSVSLRIRVKFRIILSEIKLCWFGNWKQVPLIGTYPVYFSNPLAPYVRSRWENFNLGIGNFIHTYTLKQMECPLASSLHSMYSTLEISGWIYKNHYMFIVRICVYPVYSLHGMQAGLA